MQSRWSSLDRENTNIASLVVDLDTLDAEVRELEHRWKQSLVSSPAERPDNVDWKVSNNSAVDSSAVSDSRSGCLSDTTIDSAECWSMRTDTSLQKTSHPDSSDFVENFEVGISRELMRRAADVDVTDRSTTRAELGADAVGQKFITSANVDSCFIDKHLLSEYRSCSSKLDELFDAFLTASCASQ